MWVLTDKQMQRMRDNLISEYVTRTTELELHLTKLQQKVECLHGRHDWEEWGPNEVGCKHCYTRRKLGVEIKW